MENDELLADRDGQITLGMSMENYLRTKEPMRLFLCGKILSTLERSNSEILGIKDIGTKMYPGFPAFAVSDSEFLSFCDGSAQIKFPLGSDLSLPE